MRKLSYLLLLAVISFVGCSKDGDNNGSDDTNNPPPTNEENYIQGKIEYKLTFTNPIIAKFIDSVLLHTENPAGAFQSAYLQQSHDDREILNTFRDENMSEFMGLMTLPIVKNEVFISENHASSNSVNMTFQIEKSWDIGKKTGSYYIGNIFDEDLSFNFDYAFAQGIGTVSAISTDLLYDKTEASELVKVGDLETKKITYTPKPGNIAGLSTNLVIYTSPLLRKDINILLPVYTDEENGIAKVEINFNHSEMGKVIIEISSIENRTITNEELNITVSSDHTTSKDENLKSVLNEKISNILSPVR